MTSPNSNDRAGPQMLLYQEVTHLGVAYHMVLMAVMVILAGASCIFLIGDVKPALLGTVPTFLLVLWLYLACRHIEVHVTAERLVVKFWFLSLKVPVAEIESVEIKDPHLLPDQYRGHIKVAWGYHAWEDLKVLIFHKGKGVHIRKRNGELVIVTPADPEGLCQTLRELIR